MWESCAQARVWWKVDCMAYLQLGWDEIRKLAICVQLEIILKSSFFLYQAWEDVHCPLSVTNTSQMYPTTNYYHKNFFDIKYQNTQYPDKISMENWQLGSVLETTKLEI